VNAYKVYP